MTGSEFLGLLGKFLADRIGYPRGDVGARARQRTYQGSHRVAAQNLHRVLLGQLPHALEHVADGLVDDPERWVGVDRVADDFRDCEHADHHRNHADAAEKLDAAEGEARDRRRIIESDACHQKSQHQRDKALQRPVGGDEYRAGQAKQHQPEILERAELQRELGQRGRRKHQYCGAEQPAQRRKDQTRPQRGFGLALFRHGIRLVGIGGGRRRSRHAHQAARNIAGKDRHRGRGNDGSDSGDRRHEERYRDQQCCGHGGSQSGNRTDKEPEERRQDHHQKIVGVEHQREGLQPGVAHRDPRLTAALTMRISPANPTAAAP